MIVNKDIHPERKIYYLGALVIDLLKQLPSDEIDFFTAYQKLNDVEKVSMEIFSLTLDWLYVLGVIDGKNGYIKKCF